MSKAVHSAVDALCVAGDTSAVSTIDSSAASAAAAPVEVCSSDEFPRLGMTLRSLGRLVDEQPGGRAALAGLTTSQVKKLVFVPLTAKTQLSLCEQLQAEGNDGVGVATWFVSHAWMYTFVELLEALEHFFAGEPQGLDTCIWLDLVSTSQHGTFSRPPEWWRQTFILAIQSMGNLVMVMAPWDKPVTLTRAWCILELYACCSSGCRFEVALPEAQRADMAEDLMWENDVFFEFLANVQSDSSQCSRDTDRDSIFAAVRASVGFAGLDAIVRRTLEGWMIRLLQNKIDEARAAGNEEDTGGWLHSLGCLYLEQGLNGDALRLFEEAVETRKRVMGPEDKNVLVYMTNWATAYSRMGDRARALALEQEILATSRCVYGMEHAGTIDVMANLANSYIGMQDFARGVPLMEEALAMQRRVLGDDHANTLNSMCDLAFACYQQGDYAQAELKFDEVRPMMQRALGDQHPMTLYADLL